MAIDNHNDWVRKNAASRAKPVSFKTDASQSVDAIQERKSMLYTFGLDKVQASLDAIAAETIRSSKAIHSEFRRVQELKEGKKRSVRELCKAGDYN